jgi:PAS domain S-box-containing protein
MKTARARVLVVEDEAIVAKDIAATLKAMNYEVTGIAGTGEEALALASSTRPDLVLMDIMLPGGMDGIEAASRIQTRMGIPIVFLTAHADEATLTRAKAAAPYGYLIKPFVERELEVALETARHRASMERQLDEQRRWFEAVLHGIGDAVIAANVEGAITFMNPVAEHLTGWRSDQAMGQPLSKIFCTVDERTRKIVEASEARALRDDTVLAEEPEDLILVSADGIERPITSTVSPINDAKGALLGIVAVFKDVSARKVMEKRILNRQKMQALGRLSSNIAHDFSNVIGLVAGHVAAMQEYTLPGSRAYEDVRRIQAAVEHAASLTKRILGVARASDGAGDLEIRAVPLGDIVQDATALLRDAFEKKNITVDIIDRARMPVVSVDSSHVVDMFMDLFLNAVDAMPNGGSLTISAKHFKLLKPDSKLNPRAKPGPYAVLRIQDTGAGMSHETLEHVFEPFFTTKASDLHVGLGLSVVHSAIQRYNGWIKVVSEPGQGTTFSVYMPEASEDARRDAERAALVTTGSILVVDDDETLRAEMQQILKQSGYKVHQAGSADEAIALIQKSPAQFDLTIIDVIMPGKDGQEVLSALLAVNPAAQVIMTCGFSRDYVRSVLSRGPWRFLQKPFEAEQLTGAVRRALEQKTL